MHTTCKIFKHAVDLLPILHIKGKREFFLTANYICEKNEMKRGLPSDTRLRDETIQPFRTRCKWVDVARLYLSLGMPRGLESRAERR